MRLDTNGAAEVPNEQQGRLDALSNQQVGVGVPDARQLEPDQGMAALARDTPPRILRSSWRSLLRASAAFRIH